jgi:hypothetical protein
MSDKSKKFEPPMGWIVEVNHQEVSVHRVAEHIGKSDYEVAKALEASGYKLIPDQMDVMADTAKVILRTQQLKESNLKLVKDEKERADVAESVTELDEEQND